VTNATVAPASQLAPDAPSTPVAIVGAGACGLTAAIALREAGVECVLLERDASPQGSTALSSGFIPAAPTRWQRDAGVADSAEAFALAITHKARGQAAAHLVSAYTRASAPALHMLQSHGLAFELLDGFLYPGHALRRMHCLAQRSGAALVAALEQAARTAGADLLTQARVDTLYADASGHIHGIGYERPDGSREQLRCTRLLLASNGFGGNAAMVAELLPQMRGAPFAGHAGNDGSAIAWGRALGAAVADLGGYQGHGSWVVPQGTLMTWAVIVQGGVQVNRQGERFHDETQGYSEAAVQVLAQPDGLAWNLFDAPLLELARGFPDFREAEAAGALRSAADLPALAAIIGCEQDRLQRTLAAIAPASTDAWGRRFERSLHWPLFAVKVTGALFHTQGGLDIDAECRVRRADGTLFPNLWAAGGAARGVSGNAVWGYLSGNGLLSAVAGGYLAARSMAQQSTPEPAAPPGATS
jgi:fumarate reductase flavoprotein subunit